MDKVGYKRPPMTTRFRPGVSGNPSGRPKRLPRFRDVLLAELGASIPGTDPGKPKSKLQALVRTLVDLAIGGNARAQSVVIGALARIGDSDEHESPALTPDDQELLDDYVGDELLRRAGEAEGTNPVEMRRDDGCPMLATRPNEE